MAEENVRVAVRVRPFNQREKDASSKLVIQMAGNQTIIKHPSTGEEKKFAFDFSYWSHDGFKDVGGYLTGSDSKYADQKKVFNDLGMGVLNNAWNGFNASLFAYGQTGSGKSYSVVGYGPNKGIVPMVCEDIFNKASTMKDVTVEVTFSMLEIYSERVRDLLDSKATNKTGLTIREDPKVGFYPQGLQKTLVTSYNDITKLMDEGTSNRTIAATNMNATSSRAHTIVTINLVQKYKNDAGKEMAKSSLMNLVDLAGSERADATGATGDRLKEGAAINLSLTSLGNVIAALADNSAGKNVRVPYRDSVLTKLLMNALGGNSKTIMIAAVSPADINYDESLSTLRYADRAKQIKTKAVVNEDPTEKLIKDLKDENAKLKQMLASGKVDPALLAQLSNSGGTTDAELLKKQLEENEKAMKEMQQSYEEKLKESKAVTGNLESSKQAEKAKKTPHLSNINMDPALSGTIKLLLEGDGEKKIGTKVGNAIQLRGFGIQEEHAVIKLAGGKFTIQPLSAQAKVVRNGVQLDNQSELVHLDRLVFGTSQFYQFIDAAKSSPKDQLYTFEMIQDEVARSSGLVHQGKRSNMTPEEIQCQNELIDLLPAIEEVNFISIKLDKKIKYTALPVTAEARGEYDGKTRAFVSVKNFATGLEWIWTKQKFLDRKVDMVELYQDFLDDGVINRDKFKTQGKNYDPFFESPDTPTQIGTCAVYPKSLAYMIPYKVDNAPIVDLKNRPAGELGVEILPCNAKGAPISEKDGIVVRDPKTELVNKPVSFLFKINVATKLKEVYEDFYCQFLMLNDPNMYKTEVIKGTSTPNFKFQKQFVFAAASPEMIDFILNKPFYVQVWGEQKHPQANAMNSKITTQEYFDREVANDPNMLIKANNLEKRTVDPNTQKLMDELNVYKARESRYEKLLFNIHQLMEAGGHPIPPATLKSLIGASNDQEAKKVIDDHRKNKNTSGGANPAPPAPPAGVNNNNQNQNPPPPQQHQQNNQPPSQQNGKQNRPPGHNNQNHNDPSAPQSQCCTVL